uniref:Homeobox domain-containing protein n=1 Tax=Meloidogyne hapla TaxID=6305 RepID=A0A1I8BW87_MELHA
MVSSSTTPQKHLMSKISSEKEQQLKSLQVPSTEQVVAELLSRAEEIQFQAAGVQTVDLDRYREQQEEQRQKRHFLIWLNQNGNLYPSREQKERLAEQMGTSYGKVNKLFANQRRRHHKQKSIKKEENNHRLIFDNKNDKINNLKENGEDSQIINNNCVNNIDKTIENVWNKVMESDGYNNQNNDVRGGEKF